MLRIKFGERAGREGAGEGGYPSQVTLPARPDLARGHGETGGGVLLPLYPPLPVPPFSP